MHQKSKVWPKDMKSDWKMLMDATNLNKVKDRKKIECLLNDDNKEVRGKGMEM